ncbi:SCO7613 C-terminal domain-containing membrane protein [Streptomyces sp. NPDC058646]|uniref:SCO7613 C-terminal domain-containing membrane protein n=1 Tax=Streptomyces sp. NPDC058646 TaxID=3346574 RepID=UPI0036693EAC
MDKSLPPAEELALIDRELAQLDSRRLYLLARRDWLLRLLHGYGPAPAGWGAAAGPGAPAGWGAPPPAKETSAPSAQNVLLALGAVLLAVAALAFTLVSWGSLGIGGRSAVLAAVTAAALGAPVALLRRGLRSTAESVAAVGLLLTVLDAYALYAVALPDTDPVGYAAAATAAGAALWAGYGWALALRAGPEGPAGRVPALRIPLPAAVLAAQWPLPLAALAAGAGPLGLGWALLATAVLDAALALRVRAGWAVAAWVPAAVLGAGALLTGAGRSWAAASVAGALAPGALLLAVAAFGVAVTWCRPRLRAAASAGGLAAVAALGGAVRPELDPGWVVVAHLLLALPLLAAVRAAGLPEPVRRGLCGAGALVAALAALAAWSAVVPTLLVRVGVLDEVWAASTPAADPYWPGAAVPVVLLVAAGAARWLSRALPRPLLPVVAVTAAWAGLFAAPVLLGFPVAVVLAVQSAVTAGAGALALRSRARGTAVAAGVCALAGAANVSLGALDGRTATFAVWGLLGAGCAAGAAYGAAPRLTRSWAAVCAVGYATAVLVAVCAAVPLAPGWWALPVLAVPAAVAALGPRLGGVRVAAEGSAAVAGGVAVALALAAGRAGTVALVLALAGVICAGAAVRADRRQLGWAAGALFVLATWVRLAEAWVTAPEAYTLPVTVPALAVGLLRRRRDPRCPSWTAYGPGLAATLLPSLLAAWGDPHWLRPLLLGAAALTVTLIGAQRRLQAPLLLGGAVLAAVALHELAPYVVQVVGVLPRWLPPALAGLLLLAVGATYEKRLREARRLRDALGRLG